MFKIGFVLELFGFIFFFFLSVMILLAFGVKFHTILSKNHTGKIEYKFQDTLEFCDKDTNEVVKKLDNVEFRALGKDTYMYVVKTPDLPSPEALIHNKFPPNTYLIFRQTTVEERK
jgi:hypothetical protein